MNRPFGPFFNLGRDLSYARQRGPMQGVLHTFYRVFQDEFRGKARTPEPSAGDLIAPLQDVVFDYMGHYYAAVPLDFREENYNEWLKGFKNKEDIPDFRSSRALETSRYLTAVFAILEGEKVVELQGEERRGSGGLLRKVRNLLGSRSDVPDEDAVRAKLAKQGSMYAQADAFRIYRFKPGKWADLLIQTVGSADARLLRQRAEVRSGEPIYRGWLGRRQAGQRLAERERRLLAELEDEDSFEDTSVRPRIRDHSRVD